VLPIIFRLVRISKKDVIVDVGCGKGRVINFLLFRGYRNKIVGLELDKEIAARTAKQFRRHKNVTIISGNALNNIPKDATIFYFYNPFSREVVVKFEELLSTMFPNRPIRIIYYNPKSIDVFCNGNWRIQYINFEHDLGYRRWGRINKYHELAILTHIIDQELINKKSI
jgi:SAM-dependent methyltransferase